jgi:H+-translocating NAD(P) transhydrogenase subunit alpha
VKVAPPSAEEVSRLRSGQTLIRFLAPRDADNSIGALTQAGVQGFALEAIPRISRAQVMDALSSQANVAGPSDPARGASSCGCGPRPRR